MSTLLSQFDFRMTQFTGGSNTARLLTETTGGRVKLEDAGFNWKVLGPVSESDRKESVEYVTWQCDQDAYALSGGWGGTK